MKACFSILMAVMIVVGTVLFSPVSTNASGFAEAVFYVK